MATGKRNYWIKLSVDFMASDRIDYLMQQDRGSDFVVLYIMMCIAARNTNGKLISEVGEVIIPYNAERISRESRYFQADFVDDALPVFKRIGLIYEDTGGAFCIAEYDGMIGSRSDYAEQKQRQRLRQRANHVDNVRDNVRDNVHIDQDQDSDQDQHPEIYQESEKASSSSSSSEQRARAREGDDDDDDDGLKSYLANIPFLSGAVEKVLAYRGKLSDELIKHGIERALEYNCHTYKYLSVILDSYVQDGIATVKQAQGTELKRESRKIYNPNSNRYDPNAYAPPEHVFDDWIPEWKSEHPKQIGGETIV